jgi:hypothetical protein
MARACGSPVFSSEGTANCCNAGFQSGERDERQLIPKPNLKQPVTNSKCGERADGI